KSRGDGMIDRKAILEAVEEHRKDKVPLEHYRSLLGQHDPQEMAAGSSCPYDEAEKSFDVVLMGKHYFVSYPKGIITMEDGTECQDMHMMTLILRYLENAKPMEPTGANIAYRDISGGNHYFKTFEGRCLKRLAFSFGHNPGGFKKAMAAVGAELVKGGDLAYRFRFIGNRYVTAILWLADEEFQPEAQVLFDENVLTAFDAEDLAVVGDVFISELKDYTK
ncbi:MAG: DUF3786 domain-containing protein, partial [Eubacterium sp.]